MARVYISKAGGGTVYDSANSKKVFISAVRAGFSVKEALKACNKSESTYSYWRKHDPDFRKLVEEVRQTASQRREAMTEEIPPFPEFSEKYLGTQMFWHQKQWYELLEGRAPADLHPAQVYMPGEPDMVLINTPPEHSKSTTITVNYVTWRICADPNIRVLIVSKTQDMAKKFLLSIKERLAESDTYYELQTKFGPPGGFAEGSASWTADRIYVAGRESGEKDPTVQALGIKGHIYGSRADLVIMDDCVDHTNHGDYVKQIDWIQNMVMSRVADAGGKMIIVGTRIETTDLYSEIMKSEYYGEDASPWTYLTQPAVLEYGETSKEWKTLWPFTNRAPVSINGRKVLEAQGWPQDGLWPMWNGTALARKRARMSPRNWSMVYQQEQVADDQVFATADVMGCIDEQRYAGRLTPGVSGHRPHGMEGLFIVAGLDPADVGNTAAVVVGLDRQTGVRWVLDVYNKRGTRPHELRELIRVWTDRYRIAEWRIEKNAFQGSIIQDEELRSYLYARGAVMTGHFTGSNKWDANYGVSSMAPLFKGHAAGTNLIRLPSRYQSEGARALVEQFCVVAGTLVETQRGFVPIEEIRPGDYAMTRDGLAPVAWAGMTGMADELIGLHVQGRALRCTPCHTVYDPQQDRFVPARTVKAGQALLTRSASRSVAPWPGVAGGGDFRRTATTAAGALRAGYSFTAPSGWPITATSRMVSLSTTKTTTSATISSGISGWSPPRSTWLNMEVGAAPGQSRRQYVPPGGVRSGGTSNPARWFARNAAQTSLQPASALRTATEVATERLSTAVPVYDLTIADGYRPEFFANGVLIHNCTWNPIPAGTRKHTQAGHWDAVMALWFAEIRCREMMQGGYDNFHLTSEWTSERENEGQFVVDVDFALASGGLQPWDGQLW